MRAKRISHIGILNRCWAIAVDLPNLTNQLGAISQDVRRYRASTQCSRVGGGVPRIS